MCTDSVHVGSQDKDSCDITVALAIRLTMSAVYLLQQNNNCSIDACIDMLLIAFPF